MSCRSRLCSLASDALLAGGCSLAGGQFTPPARGRPSGLQPGGPRADQLAVRPALAGAFEELDAVGDDAHRLAFLLIGGLPLAPGEPSVDRDDATAAHVGRDVLPGRTEHAHVEVVRPLRPLARLVSGARVAREAQVADAASRRQRPELGVAR